MKNDISGADRWIVLGKWLALGALILAAGCFYSCGAEPQPQYVSAVSGGANETASETIRESKAGSMAGSMTESAAESGAASERVSEHALVQESVSSTMEAVRFCVYVCGQVQAPGVYELEEGERIFRAIELAGGFTEQAAAEFLNLAEPVFDGMKIQVPDQNEARDPVWIAGQTAGSAGTGGSAGAAGSSRSFGSTEKINLNTATKEELMTLSGIGASRAEDIIRYREEQGGFARIEDIMKISGIKDASFEKIKDKITV